MPHPLAAGSESSFAYESSMPKQTLSGSLTDQLAAMYEMVVERMEDGRYSGALHYANEIMQGDPEYRVTFRTCTDRQALPGASRDEHLF